MQKQILLGIIAIVILISGCAEQQETLPVAADIGTPFQLGVNQQAFLETENMGIELLNLVDDSRCPTDFRCAVSGEVVAEIMISKGT